MEEEKCPLMLIGLNGNGGSCLDDGGFDVMLLVAGEWRWRRENGGERYYVKNLVLIVYY